MPLVLGAAILYWMYRGEDWQQIRHVMTDEMDWTWMLLSFPFGILAQMFRGWRWRQTLEPVGEKAHAHQPVSTPIFLSYAASLVIPRVGEFTRCGVLKRYEGVSFPKALGTVVTERAIDSLLVMGITAIVILLEMSTFGTFFQEDGHKPPRYSPWFLVGRLSGGGHLRCSHDHTAALPIAQTLHI